MKVKIHTIVFSFIMFELRIELDAREIIRNDDDLNDVEYDAAPVSHVSDDV